MKVEALAPVWWAVQQASYMNCDVKHLCAGLSVCTGGTVKPGSSIGCKTGDKALR